MKDIEKIFKVELSEFEEVVAPKTEDVEEKYINISVSGTINVADIEEIYGIDEEINRPLEFPQCPLIVILGKFIIWSFFIIIGYCNLRFYTLYD